MTNAFRFGLSFWWAMVAVAALVAVSALAILPAQAAQFTQQGNKLVGTGAPGVALQGNAVALSADGNTAVVGGPFDNTHVGAVWVYVRDSNGAWSQQGSKLVGSNAVGFALQGESVALSADGNTAITGGSGDDSDAGAAWVFTRDGNGAWTQQGSKLVANDAVGAAKQGFSVGLSADGNTAIVGGYADDSDAGAAWIYVRDGNGAWTQQGAKLVGTGAVNGPSRQAVSVALSADGNTAIIGGYQDDNTVGAAWVFTRDGNGVWSQQGNKLVGTGRIGLPQQGRAVALSADGNTAVVGGYLDNSQVGAAWVFTRDGNGTWTQQGNKLVGAGAVGNASQAVSVALSGDGNTALIGGPFDNSLIGAAWVFVRNGNGVWTQKGNKLVGTGVSGQAQLGHAVALSADGNTAMIGGRADENTAGAAWVFGQPSVTDVAPDSGSAGDVVTISGVNLLNVTGVTFGGAAATNVTPVDAETVTATAPPHAAGKVHVVLSTQTSGNALLRRGYTYQPQATVMTLESSRNPSLVGQRVRFTATVLADGLPARGKVIFKNGAQTLATVNLRNGVARLSTVDLTAGVHRIKAFFLRNRAFAASKASLRQRVRD